MVASVELLLTGFLMVAVSQEFLLSVGTEPLSAECV